MIGMHILKIFWSPDYMTPDGMPLAFWIFSVCINWIVLLLPLYLILRLLRYSDAKIADETVSVHKP